MSTRSRRKSDGKVRDDDKVNGKPSGPLNVRLDSCLNCEAPLGNGTTKVAEFMLSFSETSKRTFSVMEALTAIFEISDKNSKFFPILTSKNLVMCPSCATVLANLYKSYVELMQLSKPTANICKLVAKAETWHEGKRAFLSTSGIQSSDEDDDDDDDDDTDSEVELKKMKKRRGSNDDDHLDVDEDDEEYITPNGTQGKKCAGRGRKKRRASKAKNGDYGYDDDSDEDYRGPRPKRKTGSTSKNSGGGSGGGCVDRSRIRERITLALVGTPRKRIRRRPSQTREDDYKCLECDRIFKFECRLIKHMKTHMEKQRTQCHVCDKSFLYSWMLENHILGDHDHVKPQVCGICDLTFYRNELYENHFCTPKDQQESERAEKPHWCQLCGKAFQKLAHLTLHLRSHEDEKPLNCPSCSQKFKYEKCLMKHMVVHDQVHVCPLCQKIFPMKAKLNAHMQSHDVEKTYPCPIPDCDKVFKQATALQRHSKSHTGDKSVEATPEASGTERFCCDSCTKTFSRKSDLSRHMRNQVCTRKGIKKEKHEDAGSYDGDEWEHDDDAEGQQGSDGDGDSMSPGVSNSDNENNVSLPSSPSPPPSPQLNLSEEDSNPTTPAVKAEGLVLAMKSVPEAEDSFLSDKDSN